MSPLAFVCLGLLFDYLNKDEVNMGDVNRILVAFMLSLVAAAVFIFFERLCLGYFAEHVTRKYRKEYVQSLLRHDVEYIESNSPGKLGQRYSEESSRIINGLGPGLGIFIRSLACLICGVCIGLYYVRVCV